MRSLQLVSGFIHLNRKQFRAIAAHEDLYPVNGGLVNPEHYHKECWLIMIVHFADFWAAAVEEEGWT